MFGCSNGLVDNGEGSKEHSVLTYSSLLRNEILGAEIEDCKDALTNYNIATENSGGSPSSVDERRTNLYAQNSGKKASPSSRNLFTYKTR